MNDIPFGNSDFQIINFIAREYTPERAVRKVLLQLDKKLAALKAHEFANRRRELDVKEKEEQLKKAKGTKRKRLLIDIEEIRYNQEREEKLRLDCLHEIELYNGILAKLPKTDRESFEKAEITYWERRLLADARREYIAGGRVNKDTLESLERIGLKLVKDENNTFLLVRKNDSKKIPATGESPELAGQSKHPE